jgi:hypothetical protein
MAERQLRNDEVEDSKNAIELSENIESQARGSDPALKALGDERVIVTEEDVRVYITSQQSGGILT